MRNPSSSSSTTAAAAATSKTPCCSKVGLKRGPWTPEEDELLANYIKKEGEGKWRTLPKRAGLLRCGKSCRLRWMNYLRPCVKRGQIAPDEEDLILRLHRLLGNRWSLIAGRIPGRTDNEIKNYWNTHLSKKLISQGIDPRTHKPLVHTTTAVTNTTPMSATDNNKNPIYYHMSDKHFSSPYVILPPTTPPSTTQNNPSPSYYIAPSQESYSGGGGGGAAAVAVSPSASGNGTNATGAHSSFAAHQSAVMINKSTGGYLLASCNPNNYNNVHEQQDEQYPIISATATASMHVEHNVDTIQMAFTTTATTNSKKIINGRLSPSNEKEEEEDGDHDGNNYCTDDVFSSFLNSLINDDMFNNSHSQTQQQHPDHHDKNGTSDSLSSTSALVYANLSFAAAGWDAPPIMSAPPSAFNHNNHNHNQDPKSL